MDSVRSPSSSEDRGLSRNPRAQQEWTERACSKPKAEAEQLAAFVQAVRQHVADGLRDVPEARYQERMAICRGCPLFADEKCTQCGCYVPLKALWRSEGCPKGLWPAEDIYPEKRCPAC